MAFPASPSNNQVHKETNGKSFVYDSTLGTWDRILESERPNAYNLQDSYLTSGVKYPAGHVIQQQVRFARSDGSHKYLTSGVWIHHHRNSDLQIWFTPKSTTSRFLMEYSHGITHTSSSGGWGVYAFTKNKARNGWEENEGYDENYGHGASGFGGYAGMYHGSFIRYTTKNTSLTPFLLGMMIRWHNSIWFYWHTGVGATLSITEIEIVDEHTGDDRI